ncbi:MAG: hypothetical protein JRE23_00390 [Deltaproteobacteria bacterium]|nr:hypothetical protein [Deltaproteobacteria bacterium]
MKMIYLSDSKKVIKAQDIKLTNPPDTARHKQGGAWGKARACFVRDICHIPANEADLNARGNNMGVGSEIEGPGKQIEERIKIAAKEAYDKGFSEGIIEGIEREKKELSLAAESVEKLVRELKILKEEFLKSSEKGIIDLAFSIAGKVIHKEVSTGREVVLSILKDAMKNMRERDGVVIRLNPGDYCYITEVKPDFLDNYGDILIEKDEEIGQGGAVIEAHSGVVDARLDQQLDKIKCQVSEIRGSRLAVYS